MIECDVHLTKDNQAVIIHDETLDRTTDGRGRVSDYTLSEIKKLNAGKGEKIPTVPEVIGIVKGNCQLNLEIKGKKPAQEVAKIITKNRAASYSIVSGNSPEALLQVKKINSKIKTALVFWATKTDLGQIFFDALAKILLPLTKRIIVQRARKAQAQLISLGKPLATKKMIAFLHKHNLKVYVWTVNTKEEIIELQKRQTDGVFTNYPDLFYSKRH